MKKFLPKSVKNPQGFTLVELLVVISIIAILAIVGMAMYSGVAGRGRDTKRKSDVDAIAKAHEVTYDAITNNYRALVGTTDFAGGTKPTPPEGGSYYDSVATGTNATTYTVCAALEGGTANCSSSSATCYCISSAQGGTAAAPAAGLCATTVTVTGSCKTTATGVTAVYFCPTANVIINCNVTTTDPQYTVSAGSGYTAATGGTVISSAVDINKSTGSGNTVTVGVRTTNP